MTGQEPLTDEEIQLVTFRVGDHQFGFNVFEVERVLRYEAPAPLPRAPEFLEGMLAYGDDVLPVIDLRKRLQVDAPTDDHTRTIIVEWEQGRIGLIVDAVLALRQVPVDAIRIDAENERRQPPGEQSFTQPRWPFQQQGVGQAPLTPRVLDRLPALLVPNNH